MFKAKKYISEYILDCREGEEGLFSTVQLALAISTDGLVCVTIEASDDNKSFKNINPANGTYSIKHNFLRAVYRWQERGKRLRIVLVKYPQISMISAQYLLHEEG